VENPLVNAAVIVAAALAAATSVHLPVATRSPQAQAAIDRGLFFYYAYNGEAAVASFTQAATIDPQLSMAYWGIALASGPDLNTPINQERFAAGARAIAQAVALESGASAQERSMIDVMALRYKGTFANWRDDDAAYRRGMLALAQSSADRNVRLIAAEALLEGGGLTWGDAAPASEETRDALALVEGVLAGDPSNPMANHLCLHLYDLAPQREPALVCAERLDAAAFPPQAEHLAHMPAHYWIETGDYPAALASSERAFTLMQEVDAMGGDAPHIDRYVKHDISVGYSAAMMLGNYAIARLWAQRMNSALGTSFDGLTALRFGDYAAAYVARENQYGGVAVRGLAAIQLHRVAEARTLAADMLKNSAPAQGYLPQLFLARLADEDGNDAEATRWFDAAIANQRADYSGEQIPYIPAGEALGAHYLRRGDNAAAIAAFQATIATYPNDPRALFGLASAMAADGQRAQAVAVRARFDEAWKGADTTVDAAALP
jgi:tetratricopeptide (TPR) repeat protein